MTDDQTIICSLHQAEKSIAKFHFTFAQTKLPIHVHNNYQYSMHCPLHFCNKTTAQCETVLSYIEAIKIIPHSALD